MSEYLLDDLDNAVLAISLKRREVMKLQQDLSDCATRIHSRLKAIATTIDDGDLMFVFEPELNVAGELAEVQALLSRYNSLRSDLNRLGSLVAAKEIELEQPE